MYEVFDHTADLGLRIRAADLNSLFAESGRAFFSLIVSNLDDVRPQQQVAFQVRAAELDYLWLDWLNELLFIYESERLVLSDFEVRVDRRGLDAVVRGEKVDMQRHQLDHEVKAITYHDLRVEQTADGWEAEVIVDI